MDVDIEHYIINISGFSSSTTKETLRINTLYYSVLKN